MVTLIPLLVADTGFSIARISLLLPQTSCSVVLMMVPVPSRLVVQVQVSQTSQDDKAAAISARNSVFMGFKV